MSRDLDPRLREALEELERYLADQVAPLLVSDAVELLVEYPPELTSEVLNAWAMAQVGGRSGDGLADYLFHAIKKFQLFEEFNLLPSERFRNFLAELAERLVAMAPEGERERLGEMLAYLRQGRASTSPAVAHLHRVQGHAQRGEAEEARPSAPLTAEELRSLRRFSLLLERMDPGSDAAGGGEMDGEAGRQLLVLAASGATSADDLQTRMSRLRTVGVGPAVARDLVRSLAQAVPDWVVRRGREVEAVQGESVEAVRRVVRLAGDGAKTLERWKDLLRASAESFNAGAFGRAVTLLDLAGQMVTDREVEPHVADLARGAAHEAYDPIRMLQAVADPQHRDLVRRIVSFFPAWSVRELLDAIVYQPDPKRRRLLLALLELWGEEAHKPALERLAAAVAENSRDPNVWWYLRNLVYLLHRTPRPEGVDPRHELELVAPFSALGYHPSFQRETLALLGHLPDGLGSPLLVQRLGEADRATTSGTLPHAADEVRKILNSLAAALVRSGTPAARRALVEHALGPKPGAGSPEAAARLRELASVDLAGDPPVLSRLLEAVRTLQPVKLLGFVVSRNEETLSHVVRALAGTSDAKARQALEQLAERFPDREFGRLAALGGRDPETRTGAPRPEEEEEEAEFVPAQRDEPTVRPSLSGDLEVFGLPGLLQSLQQSESTGRLVLRLPSGRERAALELVGGRLGESRCGALSGEVAFFQIFEVPSPGSFEFVRTPVGQSSGGGTDMMGLLMEAMRRFDEFQRLRALIPDRARLGAGDARPTAPPGEQDGEMVRRVWTRIRSGATTLDCEEVARVDSYRLRSLLAHWLEEGAVRIEPTAAAAEA